MPGKRSVIHVSYVSFSYRLFLFNLFCLIHFYYMVNWFYILLNLFSAFTESCQSFLEVPVIVQIREVVFGLIRGHGKTQRY